MKKTRFNETQILQILKEYEAGKTADELSREHGISKSTISSWQSKYSGNNMSPKHYLLKNQQHQQPENNNVKW